MATYNVFLEINEGGNCFAHVPSLPGCMLRARDEETAVAILPQIIRDHLERLLVRDLIDEPPESIELNIIETYHNSGPFDPGDSAALFSIDRQPLSQNDLDWYLMHAAENRADLLSLIEHLPEEILGWKASEDAMSIGRILRHISRSDQWYLSHLVDPAALPAAWSVPEPEDVFEFLAVVRETFVEQFRQLGEDKRAAVFQPTHDTSNPEEQWTARKVLRRLLEHEREHIGHVQEILDEWRRHFMVRLTAERAGLIWQLIRFGEETLTQVPVFENYTAKDLLAHIAAWDDFHIERIQKAQAGKVSEIVSVDMDDRNAELYEERKDWSLFQAVGACLEARTRFEETIAPLSHQTFHRPVTLSWGTTASIRSWSEWRYRHDRTHADDLAQWREANKEARTTGPKSVLLAAMETARREMLATVALIPEEEWETRLVCGEWTLKDVLGHVADWEWFGVERWRPEQSNRSLQIPYPGSIQAWNELHAAARKDDSWERVWVDFVNARAAMRQILEEMETAELAQTVAAPWNPNDTNYRWIALWVHHERDHAADLRLVLNLPNFPERLTHV